MGTHLTLIFILRFHFLRLRSKALSGAVTATDNFAHSTEIHKLQNIYAMLLNALFVILITLIPIDMFHCGKDEQLGLWMALNNDDLRKSLLPIDQ